MKGHLAYQINNILIIKNVSVSVRADNSWTTWSILMKLRIRNLTNLHYLKMLKKRKNFYYAKKKFEIFPWFFFRAERRPKGAIGVLIKVEQYLLIVTHGNVMLNQLDDEPFLVFHGLTQFLHGFQYFLRRRSRIGHTAKDEKSVIVLLCLGIHHFRIVKSGQKRECQVQLTVLD